VPKYCVLDDLATKFELFQNMLRVLEQLLRLAEGELRGSIDLSQFGKPDIFKDDDDEDKKS
jgi:hypothetical protein